jgi:hypothetical protein
MGAMLKLDNEEFYQQVLAAVSLLGTLPPNRHLSFA